MRGGAKGCKPPLTPPLSRPIQGDCQLSNRLPRPRYGLFEPISQIRDHFVAKGLLCERYISQRVLNVTFALVSMIYTACIASVALHLFVRFQQRCTSTRGHVKDLARNIDGGSLGCKQVSAHNVVD